MDSINAIDVFAALAQATRLEAFRLIVEHEPHGLPAGEVARRLEVPQNTMSTHLAVLSRAGLITSERHGRSIIFRAEMDHVVERLSGQQALVDQSRFDRCCTRRDRCRFLPAHDASPSR